MGNKLIGQTAWISGAASGIGEATADLFAEEGANVARIDIKGPPEAVAAAGRHRSVFIRADVSVESQVRDSIAETVAAFGGLDIIVNCAGIVHVKLLHEYHGGRLGPADGGQSQGDLLLGQARRALPARASRRATW